MRKPIRFMALLLLLTSHNALAANRIALVIGNSAYETAPLVNPINDARDMGAKLRSLGFEVNVFTDLDRKGMREAIRDFGERLKNSRVGLFYYAGHGIQIKGKNFLVPLKTDVSSADEVEDESVDADSVLRKMESAGNEINIVILDACRNNPFSRSFRSLERGLAKMEGPIGSFIAYATAPGSVAADGSGSNGLYTQHLLQALNQPGMTIEQTFKMVRKEVSEATGGQQIPWESSSLTGEFYFHGEAQQAQNTANSTHPGQNESESSKPSEPLALNAPAAVASAPAVATGYLQIIGNVPNAEVTVNQVPRGNLDPSGVLNISPLQGDEVDVAVTAPGFRALQQKVKLLPGQWRQLSILLEPEAGDDFAHRESIEKSLSDGPAPSRSCLKAHKAVVISTRLETRREAQNAEVRLNDPTLHAAVFKGIHHRGLDVSDTPAETLSASTGLVAFQEPPGSSDRYWLKVFVSAREAPILAFQTNMKTIQGDITLELVDLNGRQILAKTTGSFRSAGLDIATVANREIDAQMATLLEDLLGLACP